MELRDQQMLSILSLCNIHQYFFSTVLEFFFLFLLISCGFCIFFYAVHTYCNSHHNQIIHIRYVFTHPCRVSMPRGGIQGFLGAHLHRLFMHVFFLMLAQAVFPCLEEACTSHYLCNFRAANKTATATGHRLHTLKYTMKQ